MSAPFWEGDGVALHWGDCLDVLGGLPEASIDAVVTDPPYELAFMGKRWDATGVAFDPATWAAVSRVVKPGGHVVAFGGSRTWHRLVCAIEDAGLEVRDTLAWLYGAGFPKSLNVSKAIDKAAGVEREVLGTRRKLGLRGSATYAQDAGTQAHRGMIDLDITAPATDEAARWQGWGTALKPAFEPIVLARKPLAGTVAGNVLTYGTGALNIDACRIGDDGGTVGVLKRGLSKTAYGDGLSGGFGVRVPGMGRWPANVVLDEAAAAMLDEQSGASTSAAGPVTYSQQRGRRGASATVDTGNGRGRRDVVAQGFGDSGGASRFFYTAKADQGERPRVDGVAHPTVKPLDLMRWLVRLVTPPGGVVLDPFAGSGTTVEVCLAERFGCVAIEREADYLPLIRARIARRRDPVAYVRLVGDPQLTLFDEGVLP